jgi:hypothetical protein
VSTSDATESKVQKVFLSYFCTSDNHSEWVRSLADKLAADGIHVIYDKWDLKPGHDLHAYMEQMVTDPSVDKVLLVCDAEYAKRADARTNGVGIETTIVTPHVYNQVRQEKFIPILRERTEEGKSCVPTYLQSRIYVDLCEGDAYQEEYDKLIRLIHNKPEYSRPPIGRMPAHLERQPESTIVTAGQFSRVKDAIEKDKANADALIRTYLDELVAALNGFRLPAGLSRDDYDEHVIKAIEGARPYRDQFIDFCLLYASHCDTEAAYRSVYDFLEKLPTLCLPESPSGSVFNYSLDVHKYCNRELFLYLISALFRSGRYKTAARLLDDDYFYQDNAINGQAKSGIEVFGQPVRSFDEFRKNRLKLNLHSVSGMLFKESATNRYIKFSHLVQADLVIMFRDAMINQSAYGTPSWYARLMPHAHEIRTLEIFSRIGSPSGKAIIQELFGMNTAKEFTASLAKMLGTQWSGAFANDALWKYRVNIGDLLNWDELQSKYLK